MSLSRCTSVASAPIALILTPDSAAAISQQELANLVVNVEFTASGNNSISLPEHLTTASLLTITPDGSTAIAAAGCACVDAVALGGS